MPAPPPAPLPPVGELFEQYADFVWRVLKHHGVPQADLEDLCQDVFVVVHRRGAEFEGRSTVRTWIYSIARRTALSHRGRARFRREHLSESPPETLAEGSQEQAAIDREAMRQLDRALASLSPAKRDVFVLYEIEELTMPEVAEALGCSTKTGFSRLYAARRDIAKAFRAAAARRRVA